MLGRPGRQARLDTPRHVERYLLDAENVVLAVRRHPVVVVEPVLSAVGGLLLVAVLSDAVPRDVPYVVDVLWWAWFALMGRALWRMAEWQNDWFVATDRRLLLTYGIITRKVAMMPLAKVTDLSYNRSPVGRVLGYGEFVLESAGQDQAMRNVAFLPSPDELYRRICGEIFDGSARHRMVPGTNIPAVPAGGPPDDLDDEDERIDPGDVPPGGTAVRRRRTKGSTENVTEHVTERIELRQDPGDD